MLNFVFLLFTCSTSCLKDGTQNWAQYSSLGLASTWQNGRVVSRVLHKDASVYTSQYDICFSVWHCWLAFSLWSVINLLFRITAYQSFSILCHSYLYGLFTCPYWIVAYLFHTISPVSQDYFAFESWPFKVILTLLPRQALSENWMSILCVLLFKYLMTILNGIGSRTYPCISPFDPSFQFKWAIDNYSCSIVFQTGHCLPYFSLQYISLLCLLLFILPTTLIQIVTGKKNVTRNHY